MACSVHEIPHGEGIFKRLMPFKDEKHPFKGVCEYFGFKFGKGQRSRSKVARVGCQTGMGRTFPFALNCMAITGYVDPFNVFSRPQDGVEIS